MSEERYAALLEDFGQAGVYRLPVAERPAIEAAARALGLRVLPVGLAGVRDKPAFLRAAADALQLPGYFGENWDALEESLADLRPGAGFLVILTDGQDFAAAEPGGFAMALAILEAAAELWRGDGVPFWTLVDTDAEGLPELP
jgi:hypothetical protein